MTEPTVPLRMEITIELPGTPEQVWQALATGNGSSAWFIPTDIEEREGGAVCFHMGEESSPGTIVDWEPPRRLVYSEPEWARLGGHADAAVTPLVTEYLVEARSGGTCVLRVTSSAFGTGADWEKEFIDEMEKGWLPFFEHLRLYLTHFPGQKVTPLAVECPVAGAAASVRAALVRSLQAGRVGSQLTAHGLSGEVLRNDDTELLARLDDPIPGLLACFVRDMGDRGSALVQVGGYLFSDAAPAYVERETPTWKSWIDGLAVPAA